jgi:predicted ABC-type ATPase
LTARPVLFVLAGVNGAGKSSIGGHLLARAGMAWFNPDTFARDLMAATDGSQTEANAIAWQEGMDRLGQAVAEGRSHAFETTLGGRTVPAAIAAAAASHDVLMWFCGLSSPEKHVERVRARVAAGGHDIPQAKIRERYVTSLENVIALMPKLTRLQVYDNSVDADADGTVPDPILVADVRDGQLTWPTDLRDMQLTPDWAKPLLEAALTPG